MFPHSLLPSNEKEILKEVSDELKIPYKDVLRTFNIWIDYIEHIVKKTDQTSIYFPNIGKAYLSLVRFRESSSSEKKRLKEKIKIIESFEEGKNVHKIVPISLIYGVAKKNFNIGYENYKGKKNFQFYTLDELIRRQYELFFKEDIDYRNKKEIYEKYFKNISESQKPIYGNKTHKNFEI